MFRTIMLIPTGDKIGLTSINLGIMRAIERIGLRITTFDPISHLRKSIDTQECIDGTSIHKNSKYSNVQELEASYVETFLSNYKKEVFMEEIVSRFHKIEKNVEVVLVKTLYLTRYNKQIIQSLNYDIAKVLNAEIILVVSQDSNTLKQLEHRIKTILSNSFNIKNANITGIIFNKINPPISEKGTNHLDFSEIFNSSLRKKETKINLTALQDISPLPVFGAVPWNSDLTTIRVIDIIRCLKASIINEGNINVRRVKSISFCEHRIPYVIEYFYRNTLLVIPADCFDVLIAACLEVMNGIEIGAILLTGEKKIDSRIIKICRGAFSTGLPVFSVNANTFQSVLQLNSLTLEASMDDGERIEKTKQYVADYVNVDWVKLTNNPSNCKSTFLSPFEFRYRLTKLACKAKKRIVLPEGDEPRTVKAAFICSKRNIATCVLLGNKEKINISASSQGITLETGIEIIDPDMVREYYVSRLVELRKSKGISDSIARKQLEDNIVLGTMMLEKGEVDGLVSGAIHTTANTIRPSLQIIKTIPESPLVSSIFFMLFPEQVYIYGDCAINPNPTSEQLAEIAIQSADSAVAFGIEPRVAMLSYSTGTSGAGSDVEKVREATRLAKKKRPGLVIDGPLQYDAAVITDVAKFKAPNSPVAGRATVFIFPDLNTGNITYKAVQRSADLISIGPMLQGMRKPVNDLSRGASVNDIVYTIAITAIQATHR